MSSTVTFTAIDRPPSAGAIQSKKIGKLKVPLLKSPSHFGHFTSRVSRMYNEDRYSASILEFPNDRLVFNFNIFDGHGGDQCSTYLTTHLSEAIEAGDLLISTKQDKERNELMKNYWKNIGGYWKRWYKHRKDNFNSMINDKSRIKLKEIEDSKDDWNFRLPMTFLKTDYDFFLHDGDAGSTCTSAFIETIYSKESNQLTRSYYFNRGTISKLTIAHVGDTKAILVDRHGEAHALTQAHHPSNPMESSRLRKYAAGFMTDSFGEERFVSLANTRAFGDVNFKQVGVSAEPDISEYIIGDAEAVRKMLTPHEIESYTLAGLGGNESFLVLCSDGVTGELTDQEIADIVMSNYNLRGNPRASAQLCAEEVVKFVEYIGGDDNATCLIIRLNGWGKWPEVDRTGELRQRRMDDYNPRSRG